MKAHYTIMLVCFNGYEVVALKPNGQYIVLSMCPQ